MTAASQKGTQTPALKSGLPRLHEVRQGAAVVSDPIPRARRRRMVWRRRCRTAHWRKGSARIRRGVRYDM